MKNDLIKLSERQLELAACTRIPITNTESQAGAFEIDGRRYLIERSSPTQRESVGDGDPARVHGRFTVCADHVSGALPGDDLLAANYERLLNRAPTTNVPESKIERSDVEALLRNVNVRGGNFSGYNLSGMNLSELDLASANLSGVDLRGANLSRTRLDNADLSNANLEDALLEGSTIKDANTHGASLHAATANNTRTVGGPGDESPSRSLERAIEAGSKAGIVAALRAGARPSEVERRVSVSHGGGRIAVSLLDVALMQNDVGAADYLLSLGARMDEPPEALPHARMMSLPWLYWVVRTDSERINRQDRSGQTLAHYAARGEADDLDFLLSSGRLDLSVRDRNGDSPLHIAARQWADGHKGASAVFEKLRAVAQVQNVDFSAVNNGGESVNDILVRMRRRTT